MPTPRRPLRIRAPIRHACLAGLLVAAAGAIAHGDAPEAPAATPAPYDPVATAGRRLGAGDVTEARDLVEHAGFTEGPVP